jgi:hypothetical protein
MIMDLLDVLKILTLAGVEGMITTETDVDLQGKLPYSVCGIELII